MFCLFFFGSFFGFCFPLCGYGSLLPERSHLTVWVPEHSRNYCMYKRPFKTRFPLLISYLRIPHYLPPGRRQIPYCPDHNSRLMATVTNSDWARVERPGASPHLAFTKPLLKSEQDDRDYRVIRLENGLQATLVHDGKTDKAAASLDVAVGHLYDPVCLTTISCLSSA